MDLSGKNVIYVGGFGGIGQRCVPEFLEKGVKHLMIFDLNVNAELLQEWQNTFSASIVSYIKLDITKKENIESAFKEAVAQMGSFDVLVNGSGLMDDRFIELTIEINLMGVIYSTFAAMPYMDKSKGGKGGVIVNISSVAGLEPTGMLAVYSAAKSGVAAFTRAMANPLYHAHNGISFVTICPGLTETGLLQTPKEKVTLDFAATQMAERFEMVKRQPPEVCARNLVEAVELAKNGVVWLLDLGDMKEIEFPVIWKPTLKS